MDNLAIDASGVCFRYRETEILRDVDLRVRHGEFLALIGPNGGGKTTLIRLLMGLIAPQQGTIRLLGLPPSQARRHIGYVPQDTAHHREFPIIVRDVVLLGLLGASRGGWRWTREERTRAETMLERVGLSHKSNERIGRLSGGERQRVFIARALVGQPRLLFLDEPTSSVDPEWQGRLYDLFKSLSGTMSVVLVSHDIGVISRAVQSVACVNRTLHYHPAPEITPAMLEMGYHCPVDLIAHGLPHRVFPEHGAPRAHAHDPHDHAGHRHD